MEEETTHTARKKPGPVAGPVTIRYSVLLQEDLGEWGKQQPGGLSELIRRLLKAERERQNQARQ